MEEILTVINTCGFPIACVILLAYYIRELTNAHKEEIEKLTAKFDVMSECINQLSVNLAKVFLIEERNEKDEDK